VTMQQQQAMDPHTMAMAMAMEPSVVPQALMQNVVPVPQQVQYANLAQYQAYQRQYQQMQMQQQAAMAAGQVMPQQGRAPSARAPRGSKSAGERQIDEEADEEFYDGHHYPTMPKKERPKRSRTVAHYDVGDNDDVDGEEDELKFLKSLKVGSSIKGYEAYVPVAKKPRKDPTPRMRKDGSMTDTSGAFHFDTVYFDNGTKYEVEEEDGTYRPATVYKHRYAKAAPKEGEEGAEGAEEGGTKWTIVIWFGDEEYEGMDGKYTMDEKGVMRDTDGDVINARKTKIPDSHLKRLIGDYQGAREAAAKEAKKK